MAKNIPISVPLLVALLSSAHDSARHCFEVLSIDSCEDCNAKSACYTRRAILEGEKLLEQI